MMTAGLVQDSEILYSDVLRYNYPRFAKYWGGKPQIGIVYELDGAFLIANTVVNTRAAGIEPYILDDLIIRNANVEEVIQKWALNGTPAKNIINIEYSPTGIVVREIMGIDEVDEIMRGIRAEVIQHAVDNESVASGILRDGGKFFDDPAEQKIWLTIKAGEHTRNTQNLVDLTNFTKLWNNVVESGASPTSEMWNIYNTLQQNTDPSVGFRRVLRVSEDSYRLEIYADMIEKTEALSELHHYARINKEWLKINDPSKITGEKNFFEIGTFRHPETGENLDLFCRNQAYVWNPTGRTPMFPLNKYMKDFISTYFDEMEFGNLDDSLKQSIRQSLEEYSKQKLTNRSLKSNFKLYWLKSDKDTIDDIFDHVFWNKFNQRRIRTDRYPIGMEIFNYYKQRGQNIQTIADSVITTESIETFRIAVADLSVDDFLIKLKKNLEEALPMIGYNNLDEWLTKGWREKGRMSAFFKAIQKTENDRNLVHIIDNFTVTLDKASANVPSIDLISPLENPVEFFVESSNVGWTGTAAGVFADKQVRGQINELTRTIDGLTPLNLYVGPVVVETKWGHTSTPYNINFYPDIINVSRTRLKGTEYRIAHETILAKWARDFGNKKGFLHPNDYAKDFIEGLGVYDPGYMTKNLRVDFFPSIDLLALGEYSPRKFSSFARDTNTFVVRYWGNGAEEFGRLGEITAAIARARYKKGITDIDELMAIATEELSYGAKALGYPRSPVDDSTTQLIKKLAGMTQTATSDLMFYRDILIDYLRKALIRFGSPGHVDFNLGNIWNSSGASSFTDYELADLTSIMIADDKFTHALPTAKGCMSGNVGDATYTAVYEAGEIYSLSMQAPSNIYVLNEFTLGDLYQDGWNVEGLVTDMKLTTAAGSESIVDYGKSGLTQLVVFNEDGQVGTGSWNNETKEDMIRIGKVGLFNLFGVMDLQVTEFPLANWVWQVVDLDTDWYDMWEYANKDWSTLDWVHGQMTFTLRSQETDDIKILTFIANPDPNVTIGDNVHMGPTPDLLVRLDPLLYIQQYDGDYDEIVSTTSTEDIFTYVTPFVTESVNLLDYMRQLNVNPEEYCIEEIAFGPGYDMYGGLALADISFESVPTEIAGYGQTAVKTITKVMSVDMNGDWISYLDNETIQDTYDTMAMNLACGFEDGGNGTNAVDWYFNALRADSYDEFKFFFTNGLVVLRDSSATGSPVRAIFYKQKEWPQVNETINAPLWNVNEVEQIKEILIYYDRSYDNGWDKDLWFATASTLQANLHVVGGYNVKLADVNAVANFMLAEEPHGLVVILGAIPDTLWMYEAALDEGLSVTELVQDYSILEYYLTHGGTVLTAGQYGGGWTIAFKDELTGKVTFGDYNSTSNPNKTNYGATIADVINYPYSTKNASVSLMYPDNTHARTVPYVENYYSLGLYYDGSYDTRIQYLYGCNGNYADMAWIVGQDTSTTLDNFEETGLFVSYHTGIDNYSSGAVTSTNVDTTINDLLSIITGLDVEQGNTSTDLNRGWTPKDKLLPGKLYESEYFYYDTFDSLGGWTGLTLDTINGADVGKFSANNIIKNNAMEGVKVNEYPNIFADLYINPKPDEISIGSSKPYANDWDNNDNSQWSIVTGDRAPPPVENITNHIEGNNCHEFYYDNSHEEKRGAVYLTSQFNLDLSSGMHFAVNPYHFEAYDAGVQSSNQPQETDSRSPNYPSEWWLELKIDDGVGQYKYLRYYFTIETPVWYRGKQMIPTTGIDHTYYWDGDSWESRFDTIDDGIAWIPIQVNANYNSWQIDETSGTIDGNKFGTWTTINTNVVLDYNNAFGQSVHEIDINGINVYGHVTASEGWVLLDDLMFYDNTDTYYVKTRVTDGQYNVNVYLASQSGRYIEIPSIGLKQNGDVWIDDNGDYNIVSSESLGLIDHGRIRETVTSQIQKITIGGNIIAALGYIAPYIPHLIINNLFYQGDVEIYSSGWSTDYTGGSGSETLGANNFWSPSGNQIQNPSGSHGLYDDLYSQVEDCLNWGDNVIFDTWNSSQTGSISSVTFTVKLYTNITSGGFDNDVLRIDYYSPLVGDFVTVWEFQEVPTPTILGPFNATNIQDYSHLQGMEVKIHYIKVGGPDNVSGMMHYDGCEVTVNYDLGGVITTYGFIDNFMVLGDQDVFRAPVARETVRGLSLSVTDTDAEEGNGIERVLDDSYYVTDYSNLQFDVRVNNMNKDTQFGVILSDGVTEYRGYFNWDDLLDEDYYRLTDKIIIPFVWNTVRIDLNKLTSSLGDNITLDTTFSELRLVCETDDVWFDNIILWGIKGVLFFDTFEESKFNSNYGVVNDYELLETSITKWTSLSGVSLKITTDIDLSNAVNIIDVSKHDVIEVAAEGGECTSGFKVQRGYSTISANQTSVTIYAGTDYQTLSSVERAFIRIVGTRLTGVGHDSGGGIQEPDHFMTIVQNPENLVNSITFERPAAHGTYNTRIYWEIIEFIGEEGSANEIIVRSQGTLMVTEGLGETPEVQDVRDNRDVVVFVTGQSTNATLPTETWTGMFETRWMPDKQIAEFWGDGMGDISYVSYAIVEFVGSNWTVQTVLHEYEQDGVWETETLSKSVDPNKTFIHAQLGPWGGETVDEIGHQVYLLDSDTVNFKWRSGASLDWYPEAYVWVIENKSSDMNVTRFLGTRPPQAVNPDSWTIDISSAGLTDIGTASIMGETASTGNTGGGSGQQTGYNDSLSSYQLFEEVWIYDLENGFGNYMDDLYAYAVGLYDNGNDIVWNMWAGYTEIGTLSSVSISFKIYQEVSGTFNDDYFVLEYSDNWGLSFDYELDTFQDTGTTPVIMGPYTIPTLTAYEDLTWPNPNYPVRVRYVKKRGDDGVTGTFYFDAAHIIIDYTGGSAVTGAEPPKGSIGLMITDTNTVTLWQSDSGYESEYTFEVVDWPKPFEQNKSFLELYGFKEDGTLYSTMPIMIIDSFKTKGWNKLQIETVVIDTLNLPTEVRYLGIPNISYEDDIRVLGISAYAFSKASQFNYGNQDTLIEKGIFESELSFDEDFDTGYLRQWDLTGTASYDAIETALEISSGKAKLEYEMLSQNYTLTFRTMMKSGTARGFEWEFGGYTIQDVPVTLINGDFELGRYYQDYDGKNWWPKIGSAQLWSQGSANKGGGSYFF